MSSNLVIHRPLEVSEETGAATASASGAAPSAAATSGGGGRDRSIFASDMSVGTIWRLPHPAEVREAHE